MDGYRVDYASTGSAVASGSSTAGLSKQQMLANLKAQAEQRRRQNGPETISSKLQEIENTSDLVVANITRPTP